MYLTFSDEREYDVDSQEELDGRKIVCPNKVTRKIDIDTRIRDSISGKA